MTKHPCASMLHDCILKNKTAVNHRRKTTAVCWWSRTWLTSLLPSKCTTSSPGECETMLIRLFLQPSSQWHCQWPPTPKCPKVRNTQTANPAPPRWGSRSLPAQRPNGAPSGPTLLAPAPQDRGTLPVTVIEYLYQDPPVGVPCLEAYR